MFGFFKKFFGGDKKKRYAAQRQALESRDPAKLKALAEGKDTNPEILYFLAKTGNADTRRAVALNPSTPVHASTLLAMDDSVDVRTALAGRLVELLPDLPAEKY